MKVTLIDALAERRSARSAPPSRPRQAQTVIEEWVDLVFVFAITQLSHGLLNTWPRSARCRPPADAGSVVGLDQHRLDHQLARSRPARRCGCMLFVADAASASCVVVDPARRSRIGACRSRWPTWRCRSAAGFMLWALRRHEAGNQRNSSASTVWLACGGAILASQARFGATPARACAVGDRDRASTPRRADGRFLGTRPWPLTTAAGMVEGGHMAERCGLFIIIALGESILITGATFADLDWTTGTRRDLRRRRSPAASRFGRSISTSAPSAVAAGAGRSPAIPAGWRAAATPTMQHSDRRRNHRDRGRRRTGAASPRRPYRRRDRRRRDRRARAHRCSGQ